MATSTSTSGPNHSIGSFAIAATVNYLLCILLLFRHQAQWSTPKEALVYISLVIGVAALDLAITKGLMAFGAGPAAAKTIAIACGLALNFADAVDQPVPLDFQDARDFGQLVDTGAGGPSPQDVVDEGSVHAGHLGDMGRAQAKLVRAGAQAVNAWRRASAGARGAKPG